MNILFNNVLSLIKLRILLMMLLFKVWHRILICLCKRKMCWLKIF